MARWVKRHLDPWLDDPSSDYDTEQVLALSVINASELARGNINPLSTTSDQRERFVCS